MVAGGLTEKVVSDKTVSFHFPSCGPIPPPVIMVQNVSFRYKDDTPWIYRNLEFGLDLDSRLALVRNGNLVRTFNDASLHSHSLGWAEWCRQVYFVETYIRRSRSY